MKKQKTVFLSLGTALTLFAQTSPTTDPFYTLTDLNNRLETGAAGTAVPFAQPIGAPGTVSVKSLADIMAKMPAVNSSAALDNQVIAGRWFWGLDASGWGLKQGTLAVTPPLAIVPGTVSQTIPAGYYASAGSVAGDANLIANNIKSGVTIFNVAGTAPVPSGTATAEQVLFGTTFSNAVSSNIAGTMANIGVQNITPSTADQPISKGFHDGTGNVAGDVNLISDNILSGKTIFGVQGNVNVVNTASGDAETADLLFGKKAWVKGTEVTGTAALGDNVVGESGKLTITIPDGIYRGGKTASAKDDQLISANIKAGTTIFGVTGSAPIPLGTATADKVLAGATFSNGSGTNIAGTLNQITYHLNGGYNPESNPALFTASDLPITLSTPVKNTFSFLGWFDNSELAGVPVSKIETAGNRTLWAKWFKSISASSPVLIGAPTSYSMFDIADINRDGYLDIAVDESPNAAKVYTRSGSGTYALVQNYVLNNDVYGLALCDLNIDGFPDLMTAGPDGTTKSPNGIALNNSGTLGTFTTMFSAHTSAFYGKAVTAADFDRDGFPDVVWSTADKVKVGKHWLGSSFADYKEYPITKTNPYALKSADFNGDGFIDFALSSAGDETKGLGFFINNQSGGFTEQVLSGTTVPAFGNINSLDFTFGDFNRDGRLDIAFSNQTASKSGVFLALRTSSDGAPLTYEYSTIFSTPNHSYVEAGDFNGDGILDIVRGGPVGDGQLLIGKGDGTFTNAGISLGAVIRRPRAIDLDKDGFTDLVYSNGTNICVRYAR